MLSNPYTAWAEVAMKTGEMMLASAQVIGHRTGRMASAGASPSLRDRREFSRMGMEKVEAASESAWAMGQHLSAMNAQLGLQAWKDLCDAGSAWMSLASSKNVSQAVQRQARLVQSVSQSAASASKVSDVAARMASRGLKPIHSRATANAKRLGRSK
jgi:hypothetical protein